MSCAIQINNKNPDLYFKLGEIFKTSNINVLNEEFSFFISDSFKDKFGDWTQEERLDETRIYDDGSPKIFYKNKSYYVLDKQGEKIELPYHSFIGIHKMLDSSIVPDIMINEFENDILYYIFSKNNKDFNIENLSDLKVDFNKEIQNYFDLKIKEFREVNLIEEGEDVNDYEEFVEGYLDNYDALKNRYSVDFANRVKNKLRSLGLKFSNKEDVSDEEVDLLSGEDTYDEDKQGLVKEDVLTIDPKIKTNLKVKLLLSFIEDTNNPVETQLLIPNYKTFKSFSQIWSDLMTFIPGNHTSRLDENGKLSNQYDAYIDILKEKASSNKLNYLYDVIDIFEDLKETDEESAHNIFRALSLEKYNYMTFLYDKINGVDIINASNTHTQGKVARDVMLNNLQSKYLVTDIKGNVDLNLENYKEADNKQGQFQNYLEILLKNNEVLTLSDYQKIVDDFIKPLEIFNLDKDVNLTAELLKNFVEESVSEVNINNVVTQLITIRKDVDAMLTTLKNPVTHLLIQQKTIQSGIKGLNWNTINSLLDKLSLQLDNISNNSIQAGSKTKQKNTNPLNAFTILNMIKEDDKFIDFLKQHPYRKNSLLLNKESIASLKWDVFNMFSEKGKSETHSSSSDITEIDLLLSNMSGLLNPNIRRYDENKKDINKKYNSLFSPITFANKTTISLLESNLYVHSDLTSYNGEFIETDNNHVKILKDYFLDDYRAMIKDQIDMFDALHKNNAGGLTVYSQTNKDGVFAKSILKTNENNKSFELQHEFKTNNIVITDVEVDLFTGKENKTISKPIKYKEFIKEYKLELEETNEPIQIKVIKALKKVNSNHTISFLGNSNKFNLYPELNSVKAFYNNIGLLKIPSNYEMFLEGKQEPDTFEIADKSSGNLSSVVDNTIRNSYNEEFKELFNKLNTNNVFKNLKNELKATYRKKYGEGLEESEAILLVNANMTHHFLSNSIFMAIEYQKLFTDDINRYKNFADYIKRIPALNLTGDMMMLGTKTYDRKGNVIEGITDQWCKIIIGNDIQVEPEYIKNLLSNDKLPASSKNIIRKFYKTLNDTTDAGAYMTLDRRIFINDKLYGRTPQLQAIYDKIYAKKQLTLDEIKKANLQQQKGVFFGFDDKGRKVYLKYSTFTLLPELTDNIPALNQLNKNLKKIEKPGQYAEYVFQSGVKVGGNVPIENISERILVEDMDLNELNNHSQTLDNRNWRLQQQLTFKGLKDTQIGSQIQKVILDKLVELHTHTFTNGLDGYQMRNAIENTLKQMSDISLNKFRKDLGLDDSYKINDSTKFRDFVIDAMGDKIDIDTINAISNGMELSALLATSQSIQYALFAKITKAAVKLKTNGGGFYQSPDWGFDNIGMSDSGIITLVDHKNLKIARQEVDKETGVISIKPAQALISGSIISKYIPNWKELPKEEVFGKWNTETGKREGGMIDKEFFNIIAYRIPTQGMASIDNIEIVGILPEAYGDTIIPYTGITIKTGSDYDIDKMFFMIPDMDVKYKYNWNDAKEFIKSNTNLSTNGKPDYNKLNDILIEYDIDLESDEISESDILSIFDLSQEELRDQKGFLNTNSENTEIFNSFIKKILFNSSTKFGDEFSKKYEKQINKVKYINDSYQNRKNFDYKRLSNNLIELYKTLLTDPEYYDKMMNPIDIVHIKDDLKSNLELYDSDSGKGLNFYNPSFQIKTRIEYMAGQAGIGQVANQLTSHIGNQIQKVNVLNYWGNHNLDNIDSSEETIDGKKTKYNIVDTITGYLNGFVDIAKDAYVTQANFNTMTTPLALMLTRLGVHPSRTNAFIQQPVMYRLIQAEAYNKSKSTISIPNILNNLKSDYLKKLTNIVGLEVSKNIVEAINNQENQDHISFIFEGQTITLSNNIHNNKGITIEDLKKQLKFNKPEYYKDSNKVDQIIHNIRQLQVLREYMYLKNYSKELNVLVNTTKWAEKGFGKDTIDLVISLNNHNSLTSSTLLDGYLDLYIENGTNTKMGNDFLNTAGVAYKFIKNNPELFVTSHPTFLNMFNTIASNIHVNNKYLNDSELGTIMQRSLYTFIMKDFLKDESQEIIDELLTGNQYGITEEQFLFKKLSKNGKEITIFKFLDTLKTLPQFKGNKLLNLLKYHVDPVTFINYLGLKGDNKDNFFKESIKSAWMNILTSNDVELPNGKMISPSKIGLLLMRYSMLQSGLKLNFNQFYTYIPNQYLLNKGVNNFIKNRSQILQEDIAQTREDFLEFLVKTNSDNTKLVPNFDRIKLGKLNLDVVGDSKTHFIMNKTPYEEDNRILKNKSFPRYVTRNERLFKLVFVTNMVQDNVFRTIGLYNQVNKLGGESSLQAANQRFTEFNTKKSILEENNVVEDTNYEELIQRLANKLGLETLPTSEKQLMNMYDSVIHRYASKPVPTLDRYLELNESQEVEKNINNQNVNTEVNNSKVDSSKKINIYAGNKENADLSNFAIRPFTVNVETPSGSKEYTFQSVEQGFHFYKAMIGNNPQIVKKILETTNGGILRNLTNKTNLKLTSEQVKEWDDTSKSIMLNLMYDSYAQNPNEAQKLLNTGNTTITHTQDNTRWKTDFPEVVMTVRDMLKEEGFDNVVENKTEVKPEVSQMIYNELGNKTVSDNVVIKSWGILKDATRAIAPEGIISTRVKNSNEHFGNPFSNDSRILSQNPDLIRTDSTRESVEQYINWVLGKNLDNDGIYKMLTKVGDVTTLEFEDSLNSVKVKILEFDKISEEKIKVKLLNLKNKKEYTYVLNSDGTSDKVDLELKYGLDPILEERRLWIIEQIQTRELQGKPILYYKELGEPSHATALDYLINKYNWETNNITSNKPQPLSLFSEEELGLNTDVSQDDFKC